MYTARFLEIPIIILSVKQLEQGFAHPEEVRTLAKINPLRIESYREASFTEDMNLNACMIQMQSGDNYTTTLTIQEFEKLLNDFEKQ